MINAGIEIGPFDGQQMFDAEQGIWKGIGVVVNYPDEQSFQDNPIDVDDIMIEPNGRVWVVVSVVVEDSAKQKFRLGIKLRHGVTTGEHTPSMGEVGRGAILTPRRNYIAPHWNVLLVEDVIGRIASMENMDNLDSIIPADLWSGVVDGGTLDNTGA